MKNLILLIVVAATMLTSGSIYAQATKKTDTIKVYGNCDMCKATIEGSLKKKDGIISKKWNSKTLMLTVSYDTSKITIQQIGKKIANVGYDNEYETATNEKYKSLHSCCQYNRPKAD